MTMEINVRIKEKFDFYKFYGIFLRRVQESDVDIMSKCC